MSTPVMELSTDVAEAKELRVDGETYKLLNFDHLSDEQDAEVTAAFARYDRLALLLSQADNDTKAVSLAAKLTKKRIHILTLLTTIPEEVAKKLPTAAQAELFKGIRAELTDDEEESDGDGDGADEG